MVLEVGTRTVTHKPRPFPDYWTSSQLGCWRSMFLLAKEIEGDFYESPVLREGRLHEDDIVAQMTAKGLVVTGRQDELKHPTLPLRGHPDGRFVISENQVGIDLSPGSYLLDAKSMDRAFYSRAIKDFAANFHHIILQLQSYSLMSEGHEPVYVPIKNRATGQIHEETLLPDSDIWQVIEEGISILHVAIHTDKFDYMTLPCPDTDTITARYCPYRERGMCEFQTNIPEVTEQELVQAVQDYQEGHTVETQGSKLKTDAKKVIVNYLTKNKLVAIRVGDATPTLIPMSRRSCDYEKLQELSAKLYDEVINVSEYDRFMLK